MVVWFLIIIGISPDLSEVHTKINTPMEYKYNNEAVCKAYGQYIADDLAKKIGDKGKIYWECDPVEENEFNRALPPRI